MLLAQGRSLPSRRGPSRDHAEAYLRDRLLISGVLFLGFGLAYALRSWTKVRKLSKRSIRWMSVGGC